MFAISALVAILVGYLSGCVNYAILVTRLVTGQDIRALGNLNPGAANTLRSVGKPWGLLVGFLDACKGLAPMLIADILVFDTATAAGILALYAVGIAAIVGHCFPVFLGFKGGRGVGTLLGVFLYFVPVELLLCGVLGVVIVALFFRKVRYRWGRWVPIMFITLTPFVTPALNYVVDLPIYGHVSLGGHHWAVLVGTLAASLATLTINFTFMGNRVKEAQGDPAHVGSRE